MKQYFRKTGKAATPLRLASQPNQLLLSAVQTSIFSAISNQTLPLFIEWSKEHGTCLDVLHGEPEELRVVAPCSSRTLQLPQLLATSIPNARHLLSSIIPTPGFRNQCGMRPR
jgi:hypothetical protein